MKYNQKIVFTAACLGMLMFGIVMVTLGAILPSIIDKFAVDKINAGSLMLLLSFGILLGSLVFGPVVDRYGYKNLLLVCTVFIFVGLEGIAFTSHFSFLRIFVFLIGFGGGVINGGTNAMVADISTDGKSANLSILGVFFGVGAIGVPLILGMLLNILTYELIISGVGLFVAAILVFYILIKFPEPKQLQGFPIKQGLGLLKEIPLILFGCVLFFQSGMELTVGNWTALFLKEELVIEESKAVLFFSFYWLGIVIARLVLGRLLKIISPVKVMFSSLALAMIGAVLMLVSHSIVLSIAALFLIGFGFAAVFPVILGFVGEKYAALSGTAFSIVFVTALTGGMLLPYLTGFLGDIFGLRISFNVIAVSLVCITILFSLLQKKRYL